MILLSNHVQFSSLPFQSSLRVVFFLVALFTFFELSHWWQISALMNVVIYIVSGRNRFLRVQSELEAKKKNANR